MVTFKPVAASVSFWPVEPTFSFHPASKKQNMRPVSEVAWLPIETAPKDGTVIIMNSDEGIVTAFWARGDVWRGSWGGERWVQDGTIHDDALIAHNPTSWMMLPEAPK